jgi:hypothetical protein
LTLHVYALAEHPVALPPTAGIGGGRLRAVPVDGVDAVVSDIGSVAPAADERTVLAHARVVDDLVSVNEAVLPGRFGGGFEDDGTLRDAIGPRLEKLRAALERVRGNVEIGLRVLTGEQRQVATASSGRDYLAGRLAEAQAAERAAKEIHQPLAASARADMLNVRATPELLLSAAYLIPRGDVDAFRTRVEALDRDHAELTFVCTGPWPPYSFATMDTDRS